jgi:hypothetical protein
MIRGFLRHEIKAALYKGELEDILTEPNHKQQVKQFLNSYETIYDDYTEQMLFDNRLEDFSLQEEVFRNYVLSYYGLGGKLI